MKSRTPFFLDRSHSRFLHFSPLFPDLLRWAVPVLILQIIILQQAVRQLEYKENEETQYDPDRRAASGVP